MALESQVADLMVEGKEGSVNALLPAARMVRPVLLSAPTVSCEMGIQIPVSIASSSCTL